MKTTEINFLKDKFETNEKTLLDLFKMVANDEIAPITDDSDNIIGFNFHKNVTGIKYSKIVHGQPTYGATEEERQKNEQTLLQFINDFEVPYGPKVIEKVVNLSYQLIAANIIPDVLIYSEGIIYYAVFKDKKLYDEDGDVRVDCSNVTDVLSDQTLYRLIMSEFGDSYTD